MNKQIEEMAKALTKYEYHLCERLPKDKCLLTSAVHAQVSCDYCKIAEFLVNEGYRKASDVAREIFAEIDEGFSQMIEEAENTIADAIQEENKSRARIAQYGRDVLILARNTLEKMLKKKYESEGME